VTTGMELVQAAQAHHACVHKAFSERVATLCEHATKLCTRADADKTICTNMTEACKTAKTPTP
jgi:siroheme synthase (precorrin-2 oxidase/ferrochelatase)